MKPELKIQKLDRRMTGHQFFKYRIEFPYHIFTYWTADGHSGAFRARAKTFYDFFNHLTGVFGVGPEVEDAAVFGAAYQEPLHWAFRMINNHHTYAIYVDEEGKIELEKLLLFMQLQAV